MKTNRKGKTKISEKQKQKEEEKKNFEEDAKKKKKKKFAHVSFCLFYNLV